MTPGARLQQARTARKLTVAQVAAATRIQPSMLEALEADRLPGQMSLVYVRGFLSSYARFLHLDPEPLLAQLPSGQPTEQEGELPPAPPRQRVSITIPWRLLGRVAAVSAAVAALILVNPIRWVSHVRWPALELPRISLPQAKGAKPAVRAASAKVVKPANTSAPPAALVAQRPAARPAPEAAAPPAPAVPIEPQVASIAPLQKTLRPAQLPSLETQSTQPLEVLMTASRTTWVRVRADGKLLTQERLKRGAKERWRAKSRLELVVANPSQVELSLNGQSISAHAIAYRGKLLITHRGVSQLSSPE